MAVSETGAWCGSLSGGCVEAAVVGEAKRIIESGRAELIRFGAGSRYIDIRLPCGGGLDLLFIPDPSTSTLCSADEVLGARSSVSLLLTRDGHISAVPSVPEDRTGWRNESFLARYEPDLRLQIIGHGEETISLAALASTFGADVSVLTPDERVAAEVVRSGGGARQLLGPRRLTDFIADPHTAIVFLFHDHDWEPELLGQALGSEAFFVGAMGSKRTHEKRVEILRANGIPASSLSRLVAPLGLIPSTRDPDSLALSILSQIVAHSP